jgi:hypothetical protein
MNPEHAVDIFVDLARQKALVLRRCDMHWWHGFAESQTLGSVVSEALIRNRMPPNLWESECECWDHDNNDRETIVVWHQDHQTIVGTPVCPWGKAPNVLLSEQPGLRELGDAILTQAHFSAKAKITKGTAP